MSGAQCPFRCAVAAPTTLSNLKAPGFRIIVMSSTAPEPPLEMATRLKPDTTFGGFADSTGDASYNPLLRITEEAPSS